MGKGTDIRAEKGFVKREARVRKDIKRKTTPLSEGKAKKIRELRKKKGLLQARKFKESTLKEVRKTFERISEIEYILKNSKDITPVQRKNLKELKKRMYRKVRSDGKDLDRVNKAVKKATTKKKPLLSKKNIKKGAFVTGAAALIELARRALKEDGKD